MPTVPESPRSSNTALAGGNPVKNDPTLIVLMERLDLVDSYEKFENWKSDFLDRFEFFLGEQGSKEALKAYEDFRQNRMEKVVKKVERLSDYREKGDLSVDRVSVRARNAMNEVSVVLIDTGKDVRALVPPTSADEDRAGYTKYHLGSVLVKDGFQEYERMQKCKDIMDKMREECVEAIGDEKLLEAIRKYDDEVNRFVSIMEDLGLYKIMQKGLEFDPTTRERVRNHKGDTEPAKHEVDTPSPLIPVLPFGGDEEKQEDDAFEDEGVPAEAEPEEEPVPEEPVPEETAPEEQAPESTKEMSPKRSSRTDYGVKGSWGGMPMDFGSPSSSLKVQQDLADGSGKPPASPRKMKKQPDQVFVTPARQPKQKIEMPLDVDYSSPMGTGSPVRDADDGGDDAGSVADGSVAGSVMSFTSETARILETDTPRTRKAKLEWKTVKSSRNKQEANPMKGSKPKTPKSDKNKGPKPPRPSVTKELVTKTQGSGWSMPMDEDADASSVWSRSKQPTPRSSKTKLDAGSVASNDAPIGPGIKVRRVNKPKNNEAEGESTNTAGGVESVQTGDDAKQEKKEEQNSLNEVHMSVKADEAVDGQTNSTTHHHHHTDTVVHHHHNTVEEKHIYENVHHTVKTSDAADSYIVGGTRVVHVTHRPGVEWIGTVPVIERTEEVHDTTGHVVTGKVLRRSRIRLLTFCGIDDSIDPRLLGIVAECYPLVEFAVLMRQDMAGQPRYASPEYIQRLARVQAKTGGKMNLATHLCGAFVEEIFNGNDSILGRLRDMQFRRVQINATAPYGVNTSGIEKFVETFLEISKKYPELEISIQANDGNRAFWHGVINAGVPENVSVLYDSSMGKGEVPEKWKQATSSYRCGYAGGIGMGGRNMTKRIFNEIFLVANNQAVWVSMESSMRCTKNGKDVFDLEKCYEVVDVAHECRIHSHPSFVH